MKPKLSLRMQQCDFGIEHGLPGYGFPDYLKHWWRENKFQPWEMMK